MDVEQAGRAPAPELTDQEVAGVGERLRRLRQQRAAGELSTEEYGRLVRGVLERRHHTDPDHRPERRGAPSRDGHPG